MAENEPDWKTRAGQALCKLKRARDGADFGCPVMMFDPAPEPVCPECQEDVETVAREFGDG